MFLNSTRSIYIEYVLENESEEKCFKVLRKFLKNPERHSIFSDKNRRTFPFWWFSIIILIRSVTNFVVLQYFCASLEPVSTIYVVRCLLVHSDLRGGLLWSFVGLLLCCVHELAVLWL